MATTLQNRYVIDRWPINIQGAILVMVALLFLRCAVDQPYRTFNWTGIRPTVKDTVQLIKTYGIITSAPPRHSHPRHWLMQQAAEAELIQLLDYPHGAVKATAYEALLRRGSLDRFNLLMQALNDTTTFVYLRTGCTGDVKMLGEYLVEQVFNLAEGAPPAPPEHQVNLGFTELELNQINDIYRDRLARKMDYLHKYHD